MAKIMATMSIVYDVDPADYEVETIEDALALDRENLHEDPLGFFMMFEGAPLDLRLEVI